jgi:hypothetical protein
MRETTEEKRPGQQARQTLPTGVGRSDSGRVSDTYWDAVETRAIRVHLLTLE